MFKIGEKVKYNIGSRNKPNYIYSEIRDIEENGIIALTNGHYFNSQGLHIDFDSYLINRDHERVRLETA